MKKWKEMIMNRNKYIRIILIYLLIIKAYIMTKIIK